MVLSHIHKPGSAAGMATHLGLTTYRYAIYNDLQRYRSMRHRYWALAPARGRGRIGSHATPTRLGLLGGLPSLALGGEAAAAVGLAGAVAGHGGRGPRQWPAGKSAMAH